MEPNLTSGPRERGRQEDSEFNVTLGCIVTPESKKKAKQKINVRSCGTSTNRMPNTMASDPPGCYNNVGS